MADAQVLGARETSLLEGFFIGYDWRFPLGLTPSEATFQILARVRNRRSTEFIPLIRATSAADTRGVTAEHVRNKGENGDLLIDPARPQNKRNSEFSKSNDTFNHSAEVRTYGRVLISRADPKNAMWCPLQGAMEHITTVENHSRAAALVGAGLNSKMAEAEMAVRREWREVGKPDPSFSHATIVELVCQRHSTCPTTLGLKSASY